MLRRPCIDAAGAADTIAPDFAAGEARFPDPAATLIEPVPVTI